MVSTKVCVCAILIVIHTTKGFPQIQDQDQFTPTAIPRDPGQARQLLGYDKYDKTDVKNSDKQIYYGNNWEQFDIPSNDGYNPNAYFRY